MAMTPREELIRAIEQSPDELVRVLLELLRVMQLQQSSKVPLSLNEKVIDADEIRAIIEQKE